MAKVFNVSFEAARVLLTGDKVGLKLLDARCHVYHVVGKCDETDNHVCYVVQSGGQLGHLTFELNGSIHYAPLVAMTGHGEPA
jgi:hypothetical protein